MRNDPAPLNFPRWFDPRRRQIGTFAFILNRITALGLTLYLFLHLIILGKLAQGPEAYDSFLLLAKTPLIKFGELLVIAAGFIHGLNGIRVALTSFGVGVRRQKLLFASLMTIAMAGTLFFAFRMFLAE
jgi:succinate dehydrogenase / fumarate reductase cytochrome b subunit